MEIGGQKSVCQIFLVSSPLWIKDMLGRGKDAVRFCPVQDMDQVARGLVGRRFGPFDENVRVGLDSVKILE